MSTFEASGGDPVPEVTLAREGIQLLPAGALRLRHAVFQCVRGCWQMGTMPTYAAWQRQWAVQPWARPPG
jgi:hypothetical protein